MSTIAADQSALQDSHRHVALQKTKRLALGVLIIAAVLYGAAVTFVSHYPNLSYLKALSEAAMVGALADWFAVEALFRHPLGLKIPHTRILPRNQERLGDNLGAFIQSRFLATDKIVDAIKAFGPTGHVIQWLLKTENQKALVHTMSQLISYVIDTLDEPRVQNDLRTFVTEQLAKLDLAAVGARGLAAMKASDEHQALLDAGMDRLQVLLAKDSVRQAVITNIAKALTFVPTGIDVIFSSYAQKKLYSAIEQGLQEVRAHHDHPMRQWLSETVDDLIDDLEHDGPLKAGLSEALGKWVQHADMQAYIGKLWPTVRDWIRADLCRSESLIRTRAADAADRIAQGLSGNAAFIAWVDGAILAAAPDLIATYRAKIGDFIAREVKGWNAKHLVEEIEGYIGPDLQYIRLNGALVGGLVGLTIFVLTQWLH